MRGRRLGLIVLALAAPLGAGVAALVWAVRSPPDFYQREMARQPAPAVRQQEAESFVRRTERLVEEVRNNDEWSEEFEQDQVNSWIVEEWAARFAEHVPPGLADPRIRFAPGRMELGFRYERDRVSGIVSVRLRPTIRGPNVLGIEIESVRAGLVPLPLDQILDRLVATATDCGWEIVRRDVDGKPVFEIDLGRWMPERAVLRTVEVDDHKLRVRGDRESNEPSPGDDAPSADRPVDQPSDADRSESSATNDADHSP